MCFCYLNRCLNAFEHLSHFHSRWQTHLIYRARYMIEINTPLHLPQAKLSMRKRSRENYY